MPLPKSARLLYLDTLPILRLLEFHADYYPALLRLLDVVYERRIQMITSSLTLMEVATAAFRKDNVPLAQQYHEFFTRSAYLQVREADAAIALLAARLRAQYQLGCAEALQLGTAQHCGADLIVTGNPQWREWCAADVLTLDELLEV